MNLKQMVLVTSILVGSLSIVSLTGCGGSNQAEKSADKDEIANWVAENPAPEEIPLDDDVE